MTVLADLLREEATGLVGCPVTLVGGAIVLLGPGSRRTRGSMQENRRLRQTRLTGRPLIGRSPRVTSGQSFTRTLVE